MLTDEEIAKLRLEALKASEIAVDAIYDGVNENEFLTRFKENLRHLPEMLKNEEIASLMLSNGFTIKPGMSDLKDYVYTAARAIESAATAPLLARIAELERHNNELVKRREFDVRDIKDSTAKLGALERELEEARKDAERLDFIESMGKGARDRIEQLERVLDQAREALEDMNNGWKYIRCSHGDLYGVGWDRAQDKANASIAAIDEALNTGDQR